MTIIDDSNWQTLVDGDESNRFGRGLFERVAPYGDSGTPIENTDIQLIPRSEWSARIKEQLEKKARVSDYCTFEPVNQRQTNYCWAYCCTQAGTAMRLIQGLPFVLLSGSSVAAIIKGGRNQGGWTADAMKYMTATGASTVELYPQGTTQVIRSVEVDRWRPKLRSLEWVDAQSKRFDVAITAALLGLPTVVSYNWWSHAIMGCDAVEIEPGSFGLRIRNSWGNWGDKHDTNGLAGYQVLREGKGTPDDIQILRQMIASEG